MTERLDRLFDFTGRRVLVTGAASGIGAATAALFAAHGATLVLADRQDDALKAQAARLAAESHTYDQGDPASVERLAEAAVAGRGRAVDEYAQSGTDLVPVLARREREVEEAFAKAFPELVEVPVASPSNADGWSAGRAAADAADFGVRDPLDG